MKAEELMTPRFEVIAAFPGMDGTNIKAVGDILTDDGIKAVLDQNGRAIFPIEWEKYPHLFRKLNWWEKRSIEDMPKKVISKADDKGSVYEIYKWDMERFIGWLDDKEYSCCSLYIFNPEYGYFPVD